MARLDACVWLCTARLGLLWQWSGQSLTHTWGTTLLKEKMVLRVFGLKGNTMKKGAIVNFRPITAVLAPHRAKHCKLQILQGVHEQAAMPW